MKLVQVIGQKMDIADWEYMYTPYYICTNSKTNQAQINLIVDFLSDSIAWGLQCSRNE